jgi:hypothetical protein
MQDAGYETILLLRPFQLLNTKTQRALRSQRNQKNNHELHKLEEKSIGQ